MARRPESGNPEVATLPQGIRAEAGLSQSGFARVLGALLHNPIFVNLKIGESDLDPQRAGSV